MKIGKLEVKNFGIEQETNGQKLRMMQSWEAEIETLTEKINEIIDFINIEE